MIKGFLTLLLLLITALPALAAPTNTSGPWGIDISTFTSLSTAKCSPVTAGKTMVISRVMSCNNLTIPADREIRFVNGGGINVAAGKTLTINGLFSAGLYQVFVGEGAVVFGAGSVTAIIPEWLGVSTSGADCYVAFANLITTVKASTVKTVQFSDGSYSYSVSPNFAVPFAKFLASGKTVLQYTGTANAVEINASTWGGAVDIYNMTFGTPSARFVINAPSTAQNGVFWKGVHNSICAVDVRGAGTNYAGLWVDFAVATDFYPIVSRNSAGGAWYLSAKPKYGVYVNHRGPAEPVSYCNFYSTKTEWCGTAGINIAYSNGNSWFGGTSEGNDGYGLYIDSDADGLHGGTSDKFYGMDFEANNKSAGGFADVLIKGSVNEFYSCDTEKLLRLANLAGSNGGNRISGGIHSAIQVDTGALGTSFNQLGYNRGSGGAAFTNNGTLTSTRDVKNMQTGFLYTNPLKALVSVTPGASPYTYTNSYSYPVTALVTSGTVSAITLTRAPAAAVALGITSGIIPIMPGDAITIIYSTAPFLTIFPYTAY